jgi:hypothetical protein
MQTLIIIVGIAIALAGGAIIFIFLKYRNLYREEKNYERGLKMVSLLIHLPPASEDIEIAGRDVRDVVEENISKAQVIYDILESTYRKGLSSKIYSQRHFGFEIVGYQGLVYFYAVVPVGLIDVMRQALVSAYPSVQINEAPEHNIFNPAGKISGTFGGELTLKESYVHPIATYQDLKRDALQSILNALSVLDDKEDGAAIQILLRPANPAWRHVSTNITSQKRKGNDKRNFGAESFLDFLRQFLTAFVKAPEAKSKNQDNHKELSSLDQANLDAIDDKTRYPGYEVNIRIIASSNVSQHAQTILGNIVAAFALFNAPNRNGFKYTPAEDMRSFITAYIMRFFPQSSNSKKTLLNGVELATIFHFPDQRNIPTSQLERQGSKQIDAPRNIPDKGLLLGYNVFRSVKKPIRIALSDRQQHLYVVGQTGTGKSTFLENLALQDMLSGNGFAFVDPHGDIAEKLLAMVPRERTEDVIYFCPADMDYPMGLNLFEFRTPDQKDFLIQETLNMLYKLYDPQHQGIMGPRYEHLFRNAALTVMADPAGGTFIDIPKLFRDPKFVQQKLQYVTDQNVIEFWQKEMPQSQRSNEFGDVVSWFVSKFGAFLSNEMMRRIIGQPKSAFDFRQVMDDKKILLVNLSKGRSGELNSKLLGIVFVMKFQAAAMSRANIPENERVDFSLYVDEFQNFSTESFAVIMSEARKYHLNLIVANQFTTQLTEEIRDSVFGNMGTIVSFRVGQNDVEILSKYFQPQFSGEDILRLPNYNTITRTLINGVPTQPFSMATLPSLGTPNPKLAEALKDLSSAKYGRPRDVVEKEVNDRLTTKVDARSSFGGPSPFENSLKWPSEPAAYGSENAALSSTLPTRGTSSGSSFLDEWLSKRRTMAAPKTPSLPPQSPFNSSSPSSNNLVSPYHSQSVQPKTPDETITTMHHIVHDDNGSSQTTDQSKGSLNISSNELEKQEIAALAKDIKQDATNLSQTKSESSSERTSNEDKAKSDQSDQSANNEEIFIDKEGNIVQNSAPKATPQN